MKAAPVPANEEERLRALESYEILDTLPEQVYDDLTRLAAHICDTPIALVSLVDRDRQWFKSRVGLDASETPRELAFCAHAILDDQPMVVSDAARDERFADNPLVASEPNIRFYAGAPLMTPSGNALGTLCVIDRQPRSLTDEQVQMLEALSRQVVSQLELRLGAKLQRRAQSEIELAMEKAEEANRAKSTFLANMSHELRTPLNSVIGFTQVLMRKNESPAVARTYLERILSNGKHLLALINEVLDLSKIEAGRIDLDPRPVDLDALISEVTDALEDGIAQSGVELRLEVPNDLPPLIADPLRLKEVLNNLIANALRFAAHGTVVVRVVADPDRRAETIEVCDSGIGIADDKRERIFESFAQADDSTSRRFGGTGLGLSISRALCRAMSFDLVVDSVKGEGSTFSVLLRPDAPAPEHSKPR